MNKIYTKIIRIPEKEYEFYQRYLSFGEEIPGVATDGVAETYSAEFDNGMVMEIKVCNAETEGGGAWIDPVLFKEIKKGAYAGVYGEVACGDVGDSLDNQYNLLYNGDEYQTIIVKGN